MNVHVILSLSKNSSINLVFEGKHEREGNQKKKKKFSKKSKKKKKLCADLSWEVVVVVVAFPALGLLTSPVLSSIEIICPSASCKSLIGIPMLMLYLIGYCYYYYLLLLFVIVVIIIIGCCLCSLFSFFDFYSAPKGAEDINQTSSPRNTPLNNPIST